jgi:hypothetical protein
MIMSPLLLATAGSTLSQRNNNPAPDTAAPLQELLQLPGKIITEMKAARPSSDLKLTGYRVDEVRLPRNLTVVVRGQQVVVDKAWRVTVQGGPFPVRALPAAISIDDEIAGNGIENETLSQITAITFDSSLIHEGGIVSISYGENKDTRRKLPQGLQFKQGGENQ